MSIRRRQSGFALLEVAFVVAIAGTLLVLFGQTLTNSMNLQNRSRAALHANEDCRRSLDIMAHGIRNASYATIVVNTTERSLAYQRVAGYTSTGQVLGPVEKLSWRATATGVHGVPNPGEVVLTRDGVSTVVAPRVPRYGVYFWRYGNTVRIYLQTYGAASDGQTSIVYQYDSVTFRN